MAANSNVKPPGECSFDPVDKDNDAVGFALDRALTYLHWIEEHRTSFEAARASDAEQAERELGHLADATGEARKHLARLAELLLAGYTINPTKRLPRGPTSTFGRVEVVAGAALVIPTSRLDLVLQTPDEVLARIEALSPEDRAQVSPDWLARVRMATPGDPWMFGFSIVERATGADVGDCGYKGPPDREGCVEIAYGVSPDRRGRGYATEAAAALVAFAFAQEGVRLVRAHTLPEKGASPRVLEKCGLRLIGEVIDPEDGLVWRWERARETAGR